MNKGRIKEILDYIVALCTIISCVVAVYGVFKVVNFVVDVEPIVVLLNNEVKEGNLDAKSILKGSMTTAKYDTVKVRDTIRPPQNKIPQTKKEDSLQWLKGRRLTSEEETRLDNSADNLSKKKKEEIVHNEDRYRQRMGNKMKQNIINQLEPNYERYLQKYSNPIVLMPHRGLCSIL